MEAAAGNLPGESMAPALKGQKATGVDELSRKKQVMRDSLDHLKTAASLNLSKIILNDGGSSW